MKPVTGISEAVHRLKGVFLEIPGTKLSLEEAVRVSGLDPSMCAAVMSALEDAQFLKRSGDGRYHYQGKNSPR
jgi:DNA-binding IclR family transcriptional regulator